MVIIPIGLNCAYRPVESSVPMYNTLAPGSNTNVSIYSFLSFAVNFKLPIFVIVPRS